MGDIPLFHFRLEQERGGGGRKRERERCQSSKVSVRPLGNATINNLNSNWLAFGHKELIISTMDLYKNHWVLEATNCDLCFIR